MKPYPSTLLILIALLFYACGSRKQVTGNTTPAHPDTLTERSYLPYYVPRIYNPASVYVPPPEPKNITTRDLYEQAFQDLQQMLSGRSEVDFERAIFISENPYHDGQFSYSDFRQAISGQLNFIQNMIAANDRSDTMDFDVQVNQYGRFNLADLRYMPEERKELYRKALSNWAVFKYLTDTVRQFSFKENQVELYQHTPRMYSAADPFGMNDWSHSQVINLLLADSNTGNCFALTALFKIFSDRLDAGSRICTAPQHIYIQHQNVKGQYYNVELATAGHPGDGIIQTLTYTPTEAIMSGVALRNYTAKQSIGLCLVNLAKSFEHKFGTRDDPFMLRCADLALRYDSLNLNALLLKAQVLDAKVTAYASVHHLNSLAQLRSDRAISFTVAQLEQHLARLARTGYRQMPTDMQEMILNPLQYDPVKWDRKTRNPRPFTTIQVLDPKDEEYWSLTKGMFQEVFEPSVKETYGHFTVSTQTGKLLAMDTTTAKGIMIDPVAFAYDFGARIYDARIGHFVSVDPLASKYPSMSPYSAFANNPIMFIDPDGREIRITGIIDGKETTIIYTPNQEVPKGASQFVADAINGLNYINKNGVKDNVNKVQDLVNAKAYVSIVETSKFLQTQYSPIGTEGGLLKFNSREGQVYPNGKQSPVVSLAHEIDDAWKSTLLIDAYMKTKSKSDLNALLSFQVMTPWSKERKQEELRATLGLETTIANKLGQGTRTEYITPTSVFQTDGVLSTNPSKITLPATEQFIKESNEILKKLPKIDSTSE